MADREIAALGQDLTAKILFRGVAAIPPAFGAVDGIEGFIRAAGVANIVKNEEFGFRAKEAGIADAGLFQIGLGLFCDVTCIPAVRLAGDRIVNVATDHQGGDFGYGIEEGCIRIQEQEHIGFMDFLEATDR